MKKLLRVLFAALILSLPALSGCAVQDVKFIGMGKVVYERCEYRAEISNGKAGDEKTVYTDASSEMVLTLERLEGTLAKLTAETTITFTSTPPYADQSRDYGGLTDRMSSELIFHAYSDDFNPVSVKKSAELQTSRKYDAEDKSFEAEFTYPLGKQAGTGKIKKAGKAEEVFSIKPGKLKNTFDNEQMYYMASSFLGAEFDSDLNVLLGYSKQYKVFNLLDYVSYGTTGENLTFTVAAEQTDEYNGLTAPYKDKFAKTTVSFPKGRPIVMYFSLDYVIKISGREGNPSIRKYLLLGYEQETLNGSSVTKTSFTLKDYKT